MDKPLTLDELTNIDVRALKMRELGESFRPFIDAVDRMILENGGWPEDENGETVTFTLKV